MTYSIGSEEITFSRNARPVEIAGTTQTRWYVYDSERGCKVHSGLPSQEEAFVRMAERIAQDAPVTVTFADGRTCTLPAVVASCVTGLDSSGNVVADVDGLAYPLTPCCSASGKGGTFGVVCRACYMPVDGYFGGPAAVAVPRVVKGTRPA